ncbi:MAG: hypothetical protein A2158_02450 [Chloroflexi bacterium RBG_13_46_14]|nr:MAG: hypothetical protein A2158_02450 [Chloroflexi bacterium RBG_13_46_14]
MILDIEHPLGGNVKLAGNPIKMKSIKGTPQAPPTLGQHTEEVLKSVLGYTDGKVQVTQGN